MEETSNCFTKRYLCYSDNAALYVLTITKNVLKRVNAILISLYFVAV